VFGGLVCLQYLIIMLRFMPTQIIWRLPRDLRRTVCFIPCVGETRIPYRLLAKKNFLKKATQKQLNQINIAFLIPSFLFSKVAFSLSPSKLRELWIIAPLFILTASVSMLVAHVTSVFLRLRRPQRNFAKAASLISNSNTLPFALMYASRASSSALFA